MELTDNMRFWLDNLLNKEIDGILVASRNEHLWALGSTTQEEAIMHESNSDELRKYVDVLNDIKTSLSLKRHPSKTYRIIHKEELIGEFYVDAESEEDALEKYRSMVCNGEIDFSDMEMVDSEDKAEDAYA